VGTRYGGAGPSLTHLEQVGAHYLKERGAIFLFGSHCGKELRYSLTKGGRITFYQGAFAECWGIFPRVDFLSPVASHSGRLKLDRGLY
jgi:hypothetical protein